tara:strand:+ start:729 stop:968 length:240 start_codon:yes stop_codon:yes gene_type:complete
MSYSDTSSVVKVGDNVRVVYPKQKYRSPHRTDGIYEVEKIDPSQDIYWVKYLEEGSNKVTIVKRSYIQNVVNSKFKGLE